MQVNDNFKTYISSYIIIIIYANSVIYSFYSKKCLILNHENRENGRNELNTKAGVRNN